MASLKHYGIGEWFGRLFTSLTVPQRQSLAVAAQKKPKDANQPCPFKPPRNDGPALCTKRGGVCSLRLYEKNNAHVAPVESDEAILITTCPSRFLQQRLIYKWVGETLLSNDHPEVLPEIKFLTVPPKTTEVEQKKTRAVGRIDSVLVVETHDHLEWCPLEIQAVYFSGKRMKEEFEMLTTNEERLPILRDRHRHPDWRSSGPKRLMPQLQIKVPTLVRWGKKLALVVDAAFYNQLGQIPQEGDQSNADILWFVVDYKLHDDIAEIEKRQLGLTTLDKSVQHLTGGVPISKTEFEEEIKKKLAHQKKKKQKRKTP